MKNTLTQQLSNSPSTQSFVSHTHTDYTLYTSMQVHMRKKKTSANDVHQIASKVWTQVWTTHLSSHTSLFLFHFQLYIYLCSSWVMRWAPICYWSQPRYDRNRTSSLSNYINNPPPSSPEAYANTFPVISLSFLGQVQCLSPLNLLVTRWQAENR